MPAFVCVNTLKQKVTGPVEPFTNPSMLLSLINSFSTTHQRACFRATCTRSIQWFCTHLSLSGVHSLWQLTGRLVEEELWVQIHPRTSSRGRHCSTIYEWLVQAGRRGQGHRRRGLGSWGGRAGGSTGSGREISYLDLGEWKGAHRTPRSSVTTPTHPSRTIIQISVAEVLQTWERSLWEMWCFLDDFEENKHKNFKHSEIIIVVILVNLARFCVSQSLTTVICETDAASLSFVFISS